MPYLAPTNGPPADTLGVDGDTTVDYANRFFYGPKGSVTAGSWTGTAKNMTGPTGAFGPSPILPQMVNTAPSWGPAAQFAGTTVGTANTPAAFVGSSIPHRFTPQTSSALTGVAVSNYSASGGTIFFYLYNLTDGAIVYNYNSGNGIANNTTNSVSLGNTAVPLIAGKTYQWQAQRVTAGPATLTIYPQYLMPSGSPSSLSYYTPSVLTSSTTVANAGSISFSPPSLPGQVQYYRNSSSSYLYFLEAYLSGSGVSDIFISNTTTGTNQFTQDSYGYSTLSSTLTRYTWGPFSPTTWPFLANNQYSINTYAPNGSLTVAQGYVTMTIGQ